MWFRAAGAGLFRRFVVLISACLVSMLVARAPAQTETGTHSGKPSTSLVFVVDRTLVEKDFTSAKTIISTVLRSLRDGDEYAIYISAEQPRLLQDFSDDPDLSDAALHARSGNDSRNALFDTLIEAVHLLGMDAR